MTTETLRETLRQMLAVLQAERQALAGLDIDAIMGTANEKSALCGTLDSSGAFELDEECRGLLDAAQRLNEVNRQVRNLVAANVTCRLDLLSGRTPSYNIAPSYAYAGARG